MKEIDKYGNFYKNSEIYFDEIQLLAIKNYKKAYKISKKLLGNKNPMTNFYFNKISDICKTMQS